MKRILLLCLLAFGSTSLGAQTASDWVVKGRALLDSGKNDDAVKAFEKAVKLDDKSSANHMLLAQALGNVARKANVIKQGMMAGRIKREMERARELDPTSMDPHEGLMQFYMEAPGFMGGGMDKARLEAAEISKLNKLRGHFASADLARHDKDSTTMEREYRAAANEFPDSAVAFGTLAVYFINAKRPADAFATVDRVLARKPSDSMGLFYLGRVSSATGQQLERGETALRKFIALAPDSTDKQRVPPANAHFRLGELLEKKGDKVGAKTEYQAALALNSKFEPARTALGKLK